MRITKHGKERIKSRQNINFKSQDRLIKKVLAKGIMHSETTGALNKYYTMLWARYKTANNIRIYGDYVYIFIDKTLITTYPVPNNLKKQIAKIRKKKIEELEK